MLSLNKTCNKCKKETIHFTRDGVTICMSCGHKEQMPKLPPGWGKIFNDSNNAR